MLASSYIINMSDLLDMYALVGFRHTYSYQVNHL